MIQSIMDHLHLLDVLSPTKLFNPQAVQELEGQELVNFCNARFSKNVTWHITYIEDKPHINVNAPSSLTSSTDFSKFVKLNKLGCNFGTVESPVFMLNNVSTLTGSPRRLTGNFDVRSPYLTTLKGGPLEATTYFVESNELDNLVGAPNVTEIFTISAKLTSLYGLQDSSKLSSVSFKNSTIENTDGLEGASMGSLQLPLQCNYEITEVPAYCVGVRVKPVKGLSKLFMIEGLERIELENNFLMTTFNSILNELKRPRQRLLAAQQALIDHNLEQLL